MIMNYLGLFEMLTFLQIQRKYLSGKQLYRVDDIWLSVNPHPVFKKHPAFNLLSK